MNYHVMHIAAHRFKESAAACNIKKYCRQQHISNNVQLVQHLSKREKKKC